MATYVIYVTNVSNEQINNMISNRLNQKKDNREAVLIALDELDRPVSSNEIKQYLDQKASEKAKSEAQQAYEDGEITLGDAERYRAKNSKSMDLRTVQRNLAILASGGVIDRKYDRYSLSVKGRREMQFRNFAKGYGNIALNNMMNCCFPTVHSLEINLVKLVEIFGMYIVYCFIEASRLIRADKNNQEDHWHSPFFGAPNNFDKEGKFKERKLVDYWIKDIFSPWHMLNLFLTAMSNESASDDIVNKTYDDDDKILKDYSDFYGIDDPTRISNGISGSSLPSTENYQKMNGKIPPPTVMDLMMERAAKTTLNMSVESLKKDKKLYNYMKVRSHYYNDALLYEIDDGKIELLKEILQKKYPLSYKCLQSTQNLFYSHNASKK
jgi:hypothetical protein